jgi:hypothetical protein
METDQFRYGFERPPSETTFGCDSKFRTTRFAASARLFVPWMPLVRCMRPRYNSVSDWSYDCATVRSRERRAGRAVQAYEAM